VKTLENLAHLTVIKDRLAHGVHDRVEIMNDLLEP
jgi:hypothetical protein